MVGPPSQVINDQSLCIERRPNIGNVFKEKKIKIHEDKRLALKYYRESTGSGPIT